MELLVNGYSHQGEALISKFSINGVQQCVGLEDWKEGVDNRVQRGRFKVRFRKEGRLNQLFSEDPEFKGMHKGMLEVVIPGRRWIEIHPGVSPADTAGCYLPGTTNNVVGQVRESRKAYKKIYPVIAAALEAGEEVWMTYAPIDVK
jgi:hypothetical protein